ncbi:MAG: carboxypeptidase-like regulatory domain-containing protein [Nitrososphaerales archaeon]|nr:carboxypeptidase-like regulatory domain-containing protein [Nitrososphaerales archaeon]
MSNTQDSKLHKIAGRIYGEGGSMLGGAKVACNKRETVSLFDGRYEFKDLKKGVYTITASLKGFESQSRTVAIEKDEVITLDFHLPGATGTAKIFGTVYDAETKRPITSGGTVILILPAKNKYAPLKNGQYEFDRLVEDSYDLLTSVQGYEDKRVTITLEEGEKKLQDFHCKLVLSIEPPWG